MNFAELQIEAERLVAQWKHGNTTAVAKTVAGNPALAILVAKDIGLSDNRIFAHKVLAQQDANAVPEAERPLPTLTHEQIEEQLAKEQNIMFLWHVEDVKQQRPDLDDKQCWEVLQRCKKTHDANYGMTWEHIDAAAESLFGPAPSEDDEEDVDESDADDILMNPGSSHN